MKKNYFKLMMAFTVMASSMLFSGCSEAIEDNPTPPVTTPNAYYTTSSGGASLVVNTLDDVNKFLNEIKDKLNGEEEFIVNISANQALATSASQSTITIPNVSNLNAVINFFDQISTAAAPLTVKSAAQATTVYTNNLKVNFVANDDVDLILDMPGTKVTVKKLNSIQVLNGISVLKDGGEIKTFVWAPVENEVGIQSGSCAYTEVTDEDGNSSWKPVVQWEWNEDAAARFENQKIVKGKADYARIYSYDWIKKLTIAEGVKVILDYQPYIEEIEGEGKGATISSNDIWWNNQDEKIAWCDMNLYTAEKISNVTIEPILTGEFEGATLDPAILYEVPSNIENVTIKFGRVNFKEQSTTGPVKNCKFEGTGDDKEINIFVPYQSSDSYNFGFENCEFAEKCYFSNNLSSDQPKLDENGNQVYEKRYYWWAYDEDGSPWYWEGNVTSLDDVPEANKEVGETDSWVYDEENDEWVPSKGYWIDNQGVWEDATYKDYNVTTSFTGCKYAGAALTSENIPIGDIWMPEGAIFNYEIDGTTYTLVRDSETYSIKLVPAED